MTSACSCITRTVLFLSIACAAFGQGGGTIQGTVTDSSGAVVPEVTVTAGNVATGVETERVTTAAGLYVISPLPPGEYTLRATIAGFQTLTRQHVVVDALATVGVDMTLLVGAASQEMTVSSAAPALNTEDVNLGQTVQNQVYDALPLAMGNGAPRDPTQFVANSPGVASVVTLSAGTSYTSFNGGQQSTNGFYLEGVAMMLDAQGDTRPLSYGISVEAVDQFQVEVNGETAQYQGQGFHNYQLKSGTNQFHGAAYEYFRNTDLDARGFFSSFVPLDRQNEFGGNVGGPIKRDKLFFFANYTGYYFNTSTAPTLITIPTAAERGGNFSAFPTPIYNPLSETCVSGVCSKMPFPGNIIPPTQISPVAQSFQQYLPAATNANINNNYLGILPRSIHNNNVTAKVDYNVSDKDRVYGVLVLGKWVSDYTGNLMPTGTALPLPYTSSSGVVIENTKLFQLHHTHIFSSNVLNTFSAGMTRLYIPILSNTSAGNYPEKAGLTGLPPDGQAADGFPVITFTGANAPSSWGGSPYNQAETNFVYQDNLQWVHQNHNVTFGAQLSWLRDNRANPGSGTSAAFTFANNETAGFSPAGSLLTTTGNAYASYLLGAVDAATITNNNVVWTGSRIRNDGLFVQDSWKYNKKLTLNLGLRWDLLLPYQEQFNRFSFLNPNLPNSAAGGQLGALVYGGSGPNTCNCATIAQTHYKNFEPRVGVAYSINDKTVFRGGFMMAYTPGAPMSSSGPGQTGYNAASNYSSPATGLPAFYWDQGIPTVASPPLLTPGFGAGFTNANPTGAVAVMYVEPALSGRPPYYMNWSGGFERSLPLQIVMNASYSASVAHFLPRDGDLGIFTDSMNPQYLVLGALLNAQATPANVAAAQAVVPGIALPFPTFKGTIAQMLRPFPQYSGVTCYSCDLGNSTYNSLQITFNRRLSRQLTVQGAYSLSKELDDIPNSGSLGTLGGTRNPYNGGLDKALGAIDHRNIAHVLFVYNLPTVGKTIYAPLRKAIENWSLSGILTLSTGAPLSITGSGCNDPGVNTTCIASYNSAFSGPVRINGNYGSGNALAPGATSYLAANAFVDPAAYSFGNLPRSAAYGLFAPGLWNLDLTVRRDFPITERLHLALAVDFFNIANTVIFAAPGTNIDTTNFGQVSSAANSPRKLQLNARFTF